MIYDILLTILNDSRSRGPRSPPPATWPLSTGAPPPPPPDSHGRIHGRPTTPPPVRGGSSAVTAMEKYRQAKMRHERDSSSDMHTKIGRIARHSPPPEDPRLKHRPPEPPEPAAAPAGAPSTQAKKKKKEKEVGSGILLNESPINKESFPGETPHQN